MHPADALTERLGLPVNDRDLLAQALVHSSWLHEHAGMSDDEESEITAHVKHLLNEALERADASPLPDPSTLLHGVYANGDELDTPHHR